MKNGLIRCFTVSILIHILVIVGVVGGGRKLEANGSKGLTVSIGVVNVASKKLVERAAAQEVQQEPVVARQEKKVLTRKTGDSVKVNPEPVKKPDVVKKVEPVKKPEPKKPSVSADSSLSANKPDGGDSVKSSDGKEDAVGGTAAGMNSGVAGGGNGSESKEAWYYRQIQQKIQKQLNLSGIKNCTSITSLGIDSSGMPNIVEVLEGCDKIKEVIFAASPFLKPEIIDKQYVKIRLNTKVI